MHKDPDAFAEGVKNEVTKGYHGHFLGVIQLGLYGLLER